MISLVGTAIGILSGKGGVGKTTIVANLGIVLTKEFKKNIIIIDGNITTSHLGLHLGMYNDLPVTLKEVFSKNIPLSYAIFTHPNTGMKVLPAPLSGDGVPFSKLKGIIEELKNNYEIVLVDCAPGLGKEVVSILGALDGAIIVATPDLPSVTDALKTIDLFKILGKETLGIVLNRVKNDETELSVEEVETTCGYPVVAIVPEDHKVAEAISKGSPIVLRNPKSPASLELGKLGALMIGEHYKSKGFWSGLKRLIGLKKIEHVPPIPLIKKGIYSEKSVLAKEVSDVEELKKEISRDFEYNVKDVEEDIEIELMKKIKEKLKERVFDGRENIE